MTPRLGFSLLAGFGTLIVLTAALGVTQARRASQIERELIAAQEGYSATQALLAEVRVDLYRIGMDVRDYLLDRSADSSAEMRAQLEATRVQIEGNLQMLESRMPLEDRETLNRLKVEVSEYIDWMNPAIQWTQEEKLARSGNYVRTVLLTRRKSISDVASQVEAINTANLQRARQRLEASQADFQTWLRRLTAIVLVLSVLVAGLSTTWILRLEKKAELNQQRALEAEKELRRLSQQLVKAQEDERRSLSRELHDEVGQQITALRVEIANLGRIPVEERETFSSHLKEAKGLAEQTMKTVRDLAMGLRPSILDDFGLGPAIEWQAREFSRRTGVPAHVEVNGSLNGLTEGDRTSLFRIVQEALTNITKHASASEIRIALTAGDQGVMLRVEDNGKGMDPQDARGRGLGLVGIEERAREMGAGFVLQTQPGQGTALEISIPRRLAA
ncbi:MAG: ATP-binding protein [Bryobacteraceae bacterium]|nr:MCP four helix bundle domain-containing protein [Solibacteraceae bacterium]MCO5352488.1 ATP-binding protein [Bryobacteraceae bacterium]